MSVDLALTPSRLNLVETAYFTRAESSLVRSFIEDGLVAAWPAKPPRKRSPHHIFLTRADFVRVAFLSETGLRSLPTPIQRKALRAFSVSDTGHFPCEPVAIDDGLYIHPSSVKLDTVVAAALHYADLRDRWIVRIPGVRSGTVILHSTRLTPFEIADRCGADNDGLLELIETYPNIPPEIFAVARTFVSTHREADAAPQGASLSLPRYIQSA